MKYQVLSPDNIPITCCGARFKTLQEAQKALVNWTKNYQAQGYYSQTCYNGYVRQIALNELPDYCQIIKLCDN